MSDLVAAALDYAALGWAVFPCSPINKQPLIEHGFKAASTDPETIKAWFRKWPNAMLAVATGAASGVVVLDVDRDDEKGLHGEASLAGLLNGASLPPDLTAVRTPRGGRHIYFRYPEGVTIRNSAGKLGPGLDVRGEGGYVIVPPSVMSDGKAYTWLSQATLNAMPEWLLDRIAALKGQCQKSAKARQNSTDNPPHVVELARLALAALPNDYGRDEWIKIGMAARAGGIGFEDFDGWSQKWPGYSEADTVKAWNSFRDVHSVTVASLFDEANRRATGWRRQRKQTPPGNSAPPSRQEGDPGAAGEEDYGRRADSRNTDFGADAEIMGQSGWGRPQRTKGPFYKGIPTPIERDLLDIVLEPDKARNFPLEHLPPFIRDAVEAQVRWVKVPVSLAAHCTLSACSYAAMRIADVVAPCYVDPRPLSLFMMVVALTGERKSTLDRAVMSAVYELEQEAIANQKTELRQYRAAKASYDAEVRKLTTGKAGRELSMEARETQIAALKEPQEPLEEIVITGSPTVEGIYRLLNVGCGVGALLTAEGAQFVGGHGMADTARLRTLADLSALWDNGSLTRQRAGESSKIFNKRLMASLAMQPIIAPSLLADQLAIHQGFLGRFFICHPESTIGSRPMEVNRLLTDDRMMDFERRIRQLVARPLSLKAGRRNELDLPGIHIREDTGVWELFQHFADGIEEGCRRDGPFFGVLSIAQKLAENIARLAAILTIMSDPTVLDDEARRIVSDEAMASAVHIGSFYLGEAIRLIGRKPEDAETTAVSAIARWLRTVWKHELISPNSSAAVCSGSAARQCRDYTRTHRETGQGGRPPSQGKRQHRRHCLP